jgi:hypothetical protein
MGSTKISSNLTSLNKILMSKNEKIEKHFDKKYQNILPNIEAQSKNILSRLISHPDRKIDIILNEIKKRNH